MKIVMSLYNNKKQENEFQLLSPRHVNPKECASISEIFKSYKCSNSYVLAEQTPSFNCIGWGIGVKEFISPDKEINYHYGQKEVYTTIHGMQLYQYEASSTECMKAVSAFFKAYQARSVLPNKNYVPADKISTTPKDDTIAFYFIPGNEGIKPGEGRGFTHAARYVEDVNNWVSDMWTSKLGQYKLVTHDKDGLNGSIYGDPLCYLIPGATLDNNEDL